MDRPEEDKVPTSEDFSGKNVEKYVFLYSIKHPTTWLPLGIAGLAGTVGLTSLGTAVSLEAMAGAIILGLIGVGSGVFHYFFRGENLAKKRVEELRARLEKHKQIQLHGLLQEFSVQEFREGVDIVNRLVGIYRQIGRAHV